MAFETWADCLPLVKYLRCLTFAKHIRAAYTEMLRVGMSREHTQRQLLPILALVLDQTCRFGSTLLCTWKSLAARGIVHTFARQALPMVWDFAETNPFNDQVRQVGKACLEAVDGLHCKSCSDRTSSMCVTRVCNRVYHWRSATSMQSSPIHPTTTMSPTPNLSDFFYVWLKRSVGFLYPEHFSSLLTPKKQEAIAAFYRHGGDKAAAKTILREHDGTSLRRGRTSTKAWCSDGDRLCPQNNSGLGNTRRCTPSSRLHRD